MPGGLEALGLNISCPELKQSCGELNVEETYVRKSSGHRIWRLWRSLGSGAPKGDQGSFKEVFRSFKVATHGVCRVIRSPQEAAGSLQIVPKEFLESRHVAQSNPG
ncbi:hypothetical protein N9L68_07320 [bacterium]|nr:hypothetical protein [bacterium]